jgi:exodeoxyribonuclease VII large subunit
VQAFQANTEVVWSAIAGRAERAATAATNDVSELANGIRLRVLGAVARADEGLTERERRAGIGAQRVVERADARLAVAVAALRRVPRRLQPEDRHLDAVAQRLRLLDPVHTLQRGYSITRTIDGRTVRDAAQLPVDAEIVTTFANGTARSRVEESTS